MSNDSIYDNIDNYIYNIDEPAPAKEPERQYYFIQKCKEIVKGKSEELGRPLTSAVVTFGCQMNPENGI